MLETLIINVRQMSGFLTSQSRGGSVSWLFMRFLNSVVVYTSRMRWRDLPVYAVPPLAIFTSA
jgi:hypothetical protein